MSDRKSPPDDANPSSATPAAEADGASEAGHSTEHIKSISARAQFKSEHRTGNVTGNADKDWLEAEREIDSATKGSQR